MSFDELATACADSSPSFANNRRHDSDVRNYTGSLDSCEASYRGRKGKKKQVLPGVEPGLPESESDVLTITL